MSATGYASDYITSIASIVVVWLMPIVLWLVAPHRHVETNAGSSDPLAWFLAAVCAATLTAAFFIPSAVASARSRAAAAACAGRGPAIDPWTDAGL